MVRILILLLSGISTTVFSQDRSQDGIQSSNNDIEVTVFLGVDCPISQKYVTKLNSLYALYHQNPSIKWTFIVPEVLAKKEIKAFTKSYNINFPLLSDQPGLPITHHFEATVTPEVILRRHGKTMYRGAIDNWFYALGKYRNQVTEDYLGDAIQALLRNEQPAIKMTEPIGCIIQRESPAAAHHHD